eukprot:9302666-Lingulodinium_polyedra.AAC.1
MPEALEDLSFPPEHHLGRGGQSPSLILRKGGSPPWLVPASSMHALASRGQGLQSPGLPVVIV